MYNFLKKLRVVMVCALLFSMVLLNVGNVKVFAATTLSVSHTVDNNKVTFKVSDSTNLSDTITILVVQKDNNSIMYMDQAALQNGEYTFKVLLPKGEYTGYVSSSSSEKVSIEGIAITNEEKIVSLKSLEPISVQKGSGLVLPSTVIATFDDGANREVSVKWTNVPATDSCGQFTVTGSVNGSTETVSLVVNVVEATSEDTTPPTAPANLTASVESSSKINLTWTASTDNVGVVGYKIFRDDVEKGACVLNSYSDTGLASFTEYKYIVKAYDLKGNLSDASNTVTAKTYQSVNSGGMNTVVNTEPTVKGSNISATPVLDKKTATAATEISKELLNTVFGSDSGDSKGIKTAKINVAEVEGAKNYEVTIPVGVVNKETKAQEVHINTSFGSIEVPSDMLTPTQASGVSKVTFNIQKVDKTSITDQKLKEAIGDRPVVDLSMKLDGKAFSWQNDKSVVKVSIPYTPTAEELANPEHIIVWYINGNGNATKVTNAKYDAVTHTVSFKTTHFSQYAVSFEMKTFADIGTYQWAKNQIEVLSSKGIINGTSETTFSPEANITRADFLVLLVKTLGLTTDFTDNFSDVNKGDYYYEALGIAKKLGISTGEGNNQFNPKEQISRQDMMVLCARALKVSQTINAQGNAADIKKFSDNADVASYAVESIASMVKEGIVTGDGNRLNPLGNATRAETAVIMYRIFNKI